MTEKIWIAVFIGAAAAIAIFLFVVYALIRTSARADEMDEKIQRRLDNED